MEQIRRPVGDACVRFVHASHGTDRFSGARIRAPEVGWGATRTISLLSVSAVLLAAFLAIEARVEAPLMPLGTFRLKTLAGANAVGLLLGASNTSQQLGAAIAVAVASTVAANHFTTLLGDGDTASAALTGGFQWAFWVCGAVALLAIPATFLLVRCDELARRSPP